ncbi:cytochrome P450 18a1 [Armadillidium vulgare]|nr:cytochrome P450 18a1 [Armadillidium vulgare]
MIKSINFDPKHFESPEEFRPERFINSEGKFASPTEAFIPFGIDLNMDLSLTVGGSFYKNMLSIKNKIIGNTRKLYFLITETIK